MGESEINFDEIKRLFEQAALTTTETSKQMGIMSTRISDHEIRIRAAEAGIGTIKDDFDLYKKSQTEREYIDPADKEGLRITLENRVRSILEDYGIDGRYFGRFMRKGWSDGKKKANIVGAGGVYTKKMHLEMALNYLGTWVPEGFGVEGYKKYLDKKEE